MEFTNEFTIPSGTDEAFRVLTDLERVAPCMPGATLEEVDGDTYSGRLKVRVGPMTLTYAGTARLAQQDPVAHTARIEASGREKRGAGTASADVHATLEEVDGGTLVVVTTDINVTGKPAQFGRGVMADVGSRIIDRFAANLREMLEAEPTPVAEPVSTPAGQSGQAPVAAPTDTRPADGDVGAGPRPVAHRAPTDDALDLMDFAGQATARRLRPLLAGLVVVLLVVWLGRRRDG